MRSEKDTARERPPKTDDEHAMRRQMARGARTAAIVLAVLGALAAALLWLKMDSEPFAAMPALMVGWPWTQFLITLTKAGHVQMPVAQAKPLLTLILAINPVLFWLAAVWIQRRK